MVPKALLVFGTVRGRARGKIAQGDGRGEGVDHRNVNTDVSGLVPMGEKDVGRFIVSGDLAFALSGHATLLKAAVEEVPQRIVPRP